VILRIRRSRPLLTAPETEEKTATADIFALFAFVISPICRQVFCASWLIDGFFGICYNIQNMENAASPVTDTDAVVLFSGFYSTLL